MEDLCKDVPVTSDLGQDLVRMFKIPINKKGLLTNIFVDRKNLDKILIRMANCW